MISFFKLKNLTNNNEASFGQDLNCDYLFKSGDVDWGEANANHNSYTYPGQVGTYFSSTVISSRDISIEGYVYYCLSPEEKDGRNHEERLELAYNKILKKKRQLSRIVNPEDYLRITVGEYYIDGKPDRSIIFSKNEEDNNVYFCKFSIIIECNSPLFKKVSTNVTVLQGVTPKFHFPLVFKRNKGIIFGVVSSYRLIALENTGATKIGCIIHMKSKGTVVNPRIENVFTGEFIKINKTLVNGEEIEINTSDGEQKSIKGFIDGEELNYFKYWDFQGTWLKFPIGTSLLGYSVESENESLLDISIEISPTFYELEEM